MRQTIYFSLLWGACASTSSAFAQDAAIANANPFESVSNARESRNTNEDKNVGTGSIIVPESVYQTRGEASLVTIGSVSVNSDERVAPHILANSYEGFIGLEASQENLRALASSISQAARESGYIFASAQIPPQSIKVGIVSVQLDPGPIDEIRVIGSENKRLRKILSRLLSRAAVADVLERQLQLASDLRGITLVNTAYERQNGRGVLVVTVREDKVSGYAAFDNHGPAAFGPVRARIEYDIAGLLSDDDVLTTRVISTALQPSEMIYFNSRYAATLGDGSTVVGVSAAAGRTRLKSNVGGIDVKGSNRYASIFASHALKRSRGFNIWLNGEIDYLAVVQSADGMVFQDDRIVTASVSFTGNYDVGIGRVYGGVGVTQGLGILGASEIGDPLNSRMKASGEFTKVNLWVDSILNAGGGFGVRLAANAQIASRPLLAPNEIAVGGPYFGRGYDFSERFGDEGIIGLTELRKDFNSVNNWLNWFQLYGFVDGGFVDHIGTGYGDGALGSAGGGMRAQAGKLDLGLEVGVPISIDRLASGDQSPKINMQVGMRF